MNVLLQQINAASAIAAIAQVRFVRTAVIDALRRERLLRAQSYQVLQSALRTAMRRKQTLQTSTNDHSERLPRPFGVAAIWNWLDMLLIMI